MTKELEARLRQEADWQDTDYDPAIEPETVRQAADQLERYRVALEFISSYEEGSDWSCARLGFVARQAMETK